MSRTKTIIVAAVFAFSGLLGLLAPASANAATPKPCVQSNFRSGSSGNCVGYIQSMLTISNEAKLAADKKFGSKTKAAVIAWQTEKNIQVDGIVGPETWGTLCAIPDGFDVAYRTHKVLVGCDKQLACVDRKYSTTTNSRNAYCVKQIQSMLNMANKAGISVDGRFGSQTKSATKAWQKKQKETDSKMIIDGIVGKQTWQKFCAHKMSNASEQAAYDTHRKAAGCK